MRTLNSIYRRDLLEHESIEYTAHASLSKGTISWIDNEYVLIARVRKNTDSPFVLFRVIGTNLEGVKETLNNIRSQLFVNGNSPEWIATKEWHGTKIEILPNDSSMKAKNLWFRLVHWLKSLKKE